MGQIGNGYGEWALPLYCLSIQLFTHVRAVLMVLCVSTTCIYIHYELRGLSDCTVTLRRFPETLVAVVARKPSSQSCVPVSLLPETVAQISPSI